MSKVELFDRWLGRIANAYGFWSLVPAGAVGLAGGYLSSGVDWINQLGPFGWFSSGLVTFIGSSAAFAFIARTKLWRIEAKRAARIAGDGSPFDPMARVYENKRLYLRDLAPLGRRTVIGKKFINCEIIGPGTVVLGLRSTDTMPYPTMRNSNTFDVDVVQLDPSRRSQLAIEFTDCDFESCNFFHMTLLFFQRENEHLNWITPTFRLPQIEDHSGGPT